MHSLIARLGIGGGELVAFVGGGGKSTLALGIGATLAETEPVVITTTTKMGASQIPTWAIACHTPDEVDVALADGRTAFLIGSVEGEKAIGVAPHVVDTVHASTGAAVVVEADGARRRPFKAPGPGEPVIPGRATLVVVVVGLDALGEPIGEVCHRPERVLALTGRRLDDVVRPEDVAAVVTHPDGGRKQVPHDARVALVLTKTTPEHTAHIARIRDLVAPMEVVDIGRDRGASST
jgi:molybdenum cofactor cytidylyltransferase